MEETEPARAHVQFVSGTTMFNRLRHNHEKLKEEYSKLLVLRHDVLDSICKHQSQSSESGSRTYSPEHVSLLAAHAEQCHQYVSDLLKFVRPAQGRLPALFGARCCSSLTYSLFFDLCLHLNYYCVQHELLESATTSDCIFTRRVRKSVNEYLKSYPVLPTVEGARRGANNLHVNHNINYHDGVEEALKAESVDQIAKENCKELLANDGTIVRKKRSLEVGVFASWGEVVDAEHVDDLTSYGSSVCFNETMPHNLEDYMHKLGSRIFVVLDHLESQFLPVERKAVLKIYLETFYLVAGGLDQPELVYGSRKDCFSPRFQIKFSDVLKQLKEINYADRCSAYNVCNAFKNVNSESTFEEYAASMADITCMTDAELQIALNESLHVHNYIDSVILKYIIKITENSLKFCNEDEMFNENCSISVCCSELDGTIDILCDEASRKNSKDLYVQKTAFSALAKYFFVAFTPHVVQSPGCVLYLNFFTRFSKIFTKLYCSQVDIPKSVSVSLADDLGMGLLSVIVYGTSCKTTFEGFVGEFYSTKFPTILEALVHNVSQDAVPDFVNAICKIIKAIKVQRSATDGTFSPDVHRIHHVGSGVSPMFTNPGDKRVCHVASLVSIVLSLVSHDEIQNALTCMDKLSECGICCCFDIGFILKRIFSEEFSKKSELVIRKTLLFIKNVVIDSLNGYQTKSTDCRECNLVSVSSVGSDVHNDWVTICIKGSEGTSECMQLSRVIARKLKINSSEMSYKSLKWTGLVEYRDLLKEELNPLYYEHLLYIARFGRKEIQENLFKFVYEGVLHKILQKSYCKNTNLNDADVIHALESIFTACEILLLSNPEIHLTLSESEWLSWQQIFHANSHAEHRKLAEACYGFAWAVILARHFHTKRAITPYPDYTMNIDCVGLKIVEKLISEAQISSHEILKEPCNILVMVDDFEEVKSQEAFAVVVLAWKTFAKLSSLHEFVNYLETRFFGVGGSGVLLPVATVKAIMKEISRTGGPLEGKGFKKFKLSCGVIKSVLSVIAACPTLAETRKEVLTELENFSMDQKLRFLQILLDDCLDVNYSYLRNRKAGKVAMRCGRSGPDSIGGASCVSRRLNCNQNQTGPILINHFAWPELVEFSLKLLVKIHTMPAEDPEPLQPADDESLTTAGYIGDAITSASMFGFGYIESFVTAVSALAITPEAEPLIIEEFNTSFAINHCQMMEASLEKIIYICTECDCIRDALHDPCMDFLLREFESDLQNSSGLQGIAAKVLQLWAVFAGQAITAQQLSDFLKLFMGKKPPLGSLLSTLRSLLAASITAPLSSLQFPTTTLLTTPAASCVAFDLTGSKPRAAGAVPRDGFVISADRAITRVMKDFNDMRADVIDSCCHNSGVFNCAVACAFPADYSLEWIPIVDGTSVALWCKLNTTGSEAATDGDSSDCSDCLFDHKLHMFTVGVKKLTASVFIYPSTGIGELSFRKYISKNDPSESVCAMELDLGQLLDGEWHLLTLSMPGFNTRQSGELSVQYSIDGVFLQCAEDMRAQGTIKAAPPFVLLGHRGKEVISGCSSDDLLSSLDSDSEETQSTTDSISVTNLTMFKVAELTKFEVLLMMAFGPNVDNYLAADKELCAPMLKRFITPELIEQINNCEDSSKGFSDHLHSKLENSMLNLNRQLIFQYNGCQPEYFLVYVKFASSRNEMCNRYNGVALHSAMMYGAQLAADDQLRAFQALVRLGGVGQLLFLLARIVELNNVTQSKVTPSNEFVPKEDSEYATSHANIVRSLETKNDATVDIAALSAQDSTGKVPAKESYQAQCIELLYWCVANSYQLCSQFHDMNGNAMVVRLLYSPKMDTRLEVLKSLLDQCFSESVLSLDTDSLTDVRLREKAVFGHFCSPSPRLLLVDAELFSAVLRHWHTVELKKIEFREKETLGKASNSSSINSLHNQPERVVMDWALGHCHSVDVLHRCVSMLLLAAGSTCCSFNHQQLQEVKFLEKLLTIAQVLHVHDRKALQVSPRLLHLLLRSTLDTDEARRHLSWRTSTIRELLDYLVLCVSPQCALAWHSESCIGRLVHLYQPYTAPQHETTIQKRINNLIETEVAQEVTEELVQNLSPLDSNVTVIESKGILTAADLQRIQTMPDVELVKEIPEVLSLVVAEPVIGGEGCEDNEGVEGCEDNEGSDVNEDVVQPEGDEQSTEPQIDDVQCDAEVQAVVEGAVQPTAESNEDSNKFKPQSRTTSPMAPDTLLETAAPLSDIKEVKVLEHLIASLYEFLSDLESNYLEVVVKECIKPHQLSLLTYHKSLAIRCVVIKIFHQILVRCRPGTVDVKSFKKHLSIAHHQLSCHNSSNDLLEACFNLMAGKRCDVSRSTSRGVSYDLVTSNYNELNKRDVADYILDTSAPFLAVLPKAKFVDYGRVNKFLQFLEAVIDHGTLNEGKLLNMQYLGESLILTLKESLPISKFSYIPIPNLLANLARSLLLLNKDCATKGFKLIYQMFLLCELVRGELDAGALKVCTRSATCLKALGKMILNCLGCLLEKMLVVSRKEMCSVLTSRNVKDCLAEQIAMEEKNDRREFIPLRNTTEYYEDMLPISPKLHDHMEHGGGVDCLSRILTLLKMATNFVVKLDWISLKENCVIHSQHSGKFLLFLFDLQLKILQTWNARPDLSSRAGRFRFEQMRRLHQFDVLSREYEPMLRSTLPELLYLLLQPNCDLSIRVCLLKRLSNQVTADLLFTYCRDSAEESFFKLGPFLLTLSAQLGKSVAPVDCENVVATYERIAQYEIIRGLEHPVLLSNDRVAAAQAEIYRDVRVIMERSVEDHDLHKKQISDLFNKFLILHGKLKKRILNQISIGDENLADMKLVWTKFSNNCCVKSSHWNRLGPLWLELSDSEHMDRTRKMLVYKAIKVETIHFKNPKADHNIDDTAGQTVASLVEEAIPLKSVFDDGMLPYEEQVPFPRTSEGQVYLKSEVVFSCKGWIIKPGTEFCGTIFIADGIYFKGMKTVLSYVKSKDLQFESTFYASLESISKIRKMKYRLNEVALEVFTTTSSSLFVVCDKEEDRDSVYRHLVKKGSLPDSLAEKDALAAVTKAWQLRKMSNFDYLMELNFIAGRSYNDLSQYPIFPYVLSNYSTAILDLTDAKSFRDLSRPLPAQTTEREKHFKMRHSINMSSDDSGIGFHYSNLYSNSTIVLNYLVRLPPFTLYFLHFQGGKFDQPSRTFKSIQKTYNLITRDTNADFKEAIPEMYYLPEMFMNAEGLDFDHGERTTVDHVLLPKWCGGDQRKFILYHRAALESNYVTENLQLWIDLIFGFKQTGKRSIDAFNVYHPSAYPNLRQKAPDPELWASMTTMYGEVPRQLFRTEPHPKVMEVKDKPALQFPEGQTVADTLLGVELGCFAFFPVDRSGGFVTTPGTERKKISGKRVVLDEFDENEFLAAPEEYLLIRDPAGGEHLLKVSTGDGIARAWSPGQHQSYPVFKLPNHTKVECYAIQDRQVWVGTEAGLMLVYLLDFESTEEAAPAARKAAAPVKVSYTVACSSRHQLHGHRASVAAVALCPRYNVCVSGDGSGNCCVWDTNTPSLVRIVECFPSRITHLLISTTSGDWLAVTDGAIEGGTVSNCDAGCCMNLYSINGVSAARVQLPEPVRALSMTAMMEGRNVNVIATVTDTKVKLWSSWDLKEFASADCEGAAVKLLRWSADGQQLLVMWKNAYEIFLSSAAVSKKSKPMNLRETFWPGQLNRAPEQS